ncbi:MAG: putative sulfate exporter family transporter [Eubacteriales bacterium]|nr:putative sulfate exporter family transporter [Eubacteriales bacterium]
MKTKPSKLLSGMIASVLVAIIAIAFSKVSGVLLYYLMDKVFGITIADDLIEPSIFALLLGMLINKRIQRFEGVKLGINFVSRYILRTAIVLLGLTLSFGQVLSVGKISLIVMIFTLFTAFIGGNYIGKLFGVSWRLRSLLSAGTGICGGSAIAAIAPVIDAEDSDITYSLSATYVFDVAMVIIFPFIGMLLGMSDNGFGLWTGTSVNDTSSVIAAGYTFSKQAGDVAIIVKLTRTLSIVPAVMIFSYIGSRAREKEKRVDGRKTKLNIKSIFPFFIVLFLIMVGVKSTGVIPDFMSSHISSISKFLMLTALAAIGMKTSREAFASKGKKPMVFAVGIDLLVTFVAYTVQSFMGML